MEKLRNLLLACVVWFLLIRALLGAALGTVALIEAVLWIAPLIAVFLLAYEPCHLYLVLFGILIPVFVPLVGTRRLPLFGLVPFILLGSLWGRIVLQRRSRPGRVDLVDFIMFLTSLAIILWLLVERPGMASIGADTGGAWEAMLALAAICAYWGVRGIDIRKTNWRRIVSSSIWVGGLGMVWVVFDSIALRRGPDSILVAGARTFSTNGWLFYGMLLGMCVKVDEARLLPRAWWTVGTTLLILTNALLSGFRSRLAMGPAMVGIAYWTRGMKARTVFTVVTFMTIACIVANSRLFWKVPAGPRRVLSVVRIDPTSLDWGLEYGWGEVGARSPWRTALWRVAVSRIKDRPFFGHGFGFRSHVLFAEAGAARNIDEAVLAGVATAGQFHSVPLNLMYYLGIPIAVLFCVAWGLSLSRLVKLARGAEGWRGAFLVGILLLMVAETGQCLVNGSGMTFIPLCMTMALTRLAEFHQEAEQDKEEMEERQLRENKP